jgi:peptidoglycan/LPS O-acetylase OafA/YrhL
VRQQDRIAVLDGWRGIAVVALLVGHAFAIERYEFATLGVELFFVLSGSLMARLLFLRKEDLPTFYKRRISRILPAAYVFVGVMAVRALIHHTSPNPVEGFAACTFWMNYYYPTVGWGGMTMPLMHFWSLSVEEHSYIILSLTALLNRRHGVPIITLLTALIAISFASMAFWWFRSHLLQDELWRSEVRCGSVFMGALWSVLRARHMAAEAAMPQPPTLYARLARPAPLTVALCAALLLRLPAVPTVVQYTAGTMLLAFVVNHLDLLPSAAQRMLSFRPLVRLGVWSFSIYLWQQVWLLLGVKNIAFGIAAGVASFYLVENPAREWLNRTWARRQDVLEETGKHRPAGKVAAEDMTKFSAPAARHPS